MDSLITAAARALAAGDPVGALKRVALRDDAAALALRGIAMAQLGDLVRANALLRSAARAFGPREAVARAMRRRRGRDRAGLARSRLANEGARCGTGDARGAWRPSQGSAYADARGPAAVADRPARRGGGGIGGTGSRPPSRPHCAPRMNWPFAGVGATRDGFTLAPCGVLRRARGGAAGAAGRGCAWRGARLARRW